MGESRVDAILDSIYDAALDPSAWAMVMKCVSEFVGADRAIVGYSDVQTELASVFDMYHINEQIFSEKWVGDFELYDPWAHTGAMLRAGDVRTGCQLMPIEELRRQPVYHEIFLNLGIEDCLVAFLATSGTCISVLSLYRNRDQDVFGRVALNRLVHLAPHLVRAAKIHAQLTKIERVSSAHEQALDLLPVAAVLCDEKRNILAFNSAAEELFRQNDGLTASQGRLRATRIEDDKALASATAKAGRTALHQSQAGGATLAVRRPSMKRSYGLIVSPVSEYQGARLFLPGILTPSTIVLISDPEGLPRLPEDRIATLFSLSPAESRLAIAIISGKSLREYADDTGISIHTAQSHMKSALHKTGTHRQADFVRLIVTSVAGFRAE